MRPRTEIRFAVGARNALRSSIWKAQTQGEEAYVFAEMFGSEAKVSLHSSGDCAWSGTSKWVIRTESQNADRHIKKWIVAPPVLSNSTTIFRVEIPVSELRPYEAPNIKKKVVWIGGAPTGSTVRVVFYRTPYSELDPAIGAKLPHRHLFSLRFRSGQWLVALLDLISFSGGDLNKVRQSIREMMSDTEMNLPLSNLRACAFMESGIDQPPGLLELALDGGEECERTPPTQPS